jgi:Methylmalonyl-CoA mutase, N-terminal domain/subunit
MADSKEKLFSEFPGVSTDDWMAKITADLKGADFEKKLVWKTNEGFKVKPFYRQEDLKGLKTVEGLPGVFPFLRGNKKDDNTWLIRQDINVVSAKDANLKAKDLLNKGIDSLGFSIKAKEISSTFISELLDGIDAEKIELNFSTCQGHTVALAKELVSFFTSKGFDFKKLKVL